MIEAMRHREESSTTDIQLINWHSRKKLLPIGFGLYRDL